jgi:Mn2+/Fe2+ NRAMP family transporter
VNLKPLIRSLLPGIFLFGYCIGTGSVTAMAKAGSEFGMALLWAILLSCVITYFLLDLYGRFTLVTGETALAAFRRHLHPLVGVFFVVALTVNISGSVIGVMGILADVCHVWSLKFVEGGVPRVAFAAFFIVLVYALFLSGRTRTFQNCMAVLVAVMSFSFLLNLFVTAPPVAEIAAGLVPRLPAVAEGQNAFLVIASMVGTTVFSGLFILRGAFVRQAGWTIEHLAMQRRDAIFSATMMFVVSAAVMAAGAGTLHVQGIRMETVSQMLTLLEPLAGAFAMTLFAVGVIAAGLSSQFPNVALLPWLLNDYHGRGSDVRRLDYRLYVLGISCLGLIVPLFNARPIAVMMASQAFGALILPATTVCLLILGNRKTLMGRHAFSLPVNLLLVGVLLFALTMSTFSLGGLLSALK